MIRIFVTGDNHIGLKYADYEQRDILAARRIEAFEDMVKAANNEECDLFVITGDLFESTRSASKGEIKKLLVMLSNFSGIVAVLPGNHDYYDKDVKVWQDFESLLPEHHNIILMREYKTYELEVGDERVILYPALCTLKHSKSGENNLDWIKKENIEPDGSYRIGVAHGAVEGETPDSEGKYFLMSRSELESIPLDLWLIGHTHVQFPRNLSSEFAPCEKVLNAGTHVQTNVSCNTEGCCFVVEMGEEKMIRAKKVVSGNLRFWRKNIELTAGNMSETLERELADIDADSVVDIVLSGAVSDEEYNHRFDVIENALRRFIEGTYKDSELSKLISKERIEKEFPETSFSAKLLEALLDEPKEAQLVYDLLESLKEGKKA